MRLTEDTDQHVRAYAASVQAPTDNAAVVALIAYGLRYLAEREQAITRPVNAGRGYTR